MSPVSPSLPLQFMDLRTRYTALVTLTTQHVKYISDALRRLEEEEVRASRGAELYSKRAGSFPNAPTDAAPRWGYTSGAAPESLSAFGNLGPPLTWLSSSLLSLQKVVEEEKQEHVDKVKELLGWALGVKQSVQGRTAAAGSRELGDIEKSISEQQVKRGATIRQFV